MSNLLARFVLMLNSTLPSPAEGQAPIDLNLSPANMARQIPMFVLIAALLFQATPLMASPGYVCLSISSSEEFDVQTSEPWTGDRTLYVWTRECIEPSGGSKFTLVGNLEVVDLIPREGVVNEGTVSSPILRYSECMTRSVVAEITVRDAVGEGGTVCFSTPGNSPENCGFYCGGGNCVATLAYGFATSGVEACPVPVSTETSSWGVVKAIFR